MKTNWFGATEQVKKALENVGAEKDANGYYTRLSPDEHVIIGLGGDEILIPTSMEVKVKGEWVKLVSLLPESVMVNVL